MDGVLVAEDVRKSYGDTVALAGVSLSVAPGEVFGLVGPNGAGKTTLVRSLTGTTRVEGRVSVLGSTPTDVDPARIGLLPQDFDPPERLSPRELLAYYAGLYDDARDIDALLADVGMTDRADTWYEKLSGGERRRTCVAIALVNDPDVLFLDEPTTGIDPAGRRDLWELVESLADGGTTVFLTSHYMDEVERLADRVGLLDDGRLVAVGAPDELIAAHGGDDRLVVQASDEIPPDAVDAIPARFAVESDDDSLTFRGVTPHDVGDAIAALDDAGIGYESLTWTQPSLEDVYLRLTGEVVDSDTGDAVATTPTVRRAVEEDES